MGLPLLAVLGNSVLQSFNAFIWLTDWVIRVTRALRKPKNWLVVCRKRFRIARKTIFVIPNDLSPVTKSNLVEVTLQPAEMVMDTIYENTAVRLQDTLAFLEPRLAPRKPVILPFPFLPLPKIFF